MSSTGGAGPQECSGRIPAGLSAEDLKKYLMGARMVRCDEAAWKMWNISMAGWNAIPSGGLALLLLVPCVEARAIRPSQREQLGREDR